MKKFLIFITLICSHIIYGQDIDSLMQSLEQGREKEEIISTFKSPKLVLLQTNETQKKKNLTFWVGHRFGDIGGASGGSHTFFGLDNATDIHLGFDYGITDDITVGIGRSRFDETYNVQGKFRVLKQIPEEIPVSITLFGQSSWITRKEFFENEFPNEADRISHFLQVIVARKFSPSLSLMLNPGYLIRGQVEDPGDKENFFIIGMGGRWKFSKNFSIIADYTIVNGLDRPGDLESDFTNPLGIGLEIQTGGHVFSLNFMNARFITANNFIPNTTSSWGDGEVRFGFTISRTFFLGPRDQKPY